MGQCEDMSQQPACGGTELQVCMGTGISILFSIMREGQQVLPRNTSF